MSGWRRRQGRCNRRLLITAVVVVATVGLVVLLGTGKRATSRGTVGLEAESNWPSYSSQLDSHTPPNLRGPGTVVVKTRGSESLLERLLKGQGTSQYIITLDMTRPASGNIFCFHTKTEPSYPVCPHSTAQDRHISNQLKEEGVWQPHTLVLLPVALRYYPHSTLVDVGAHVGVFSLLGARLGATVVAVEPVWASAVRLHAGAAAGGVSTRVTLLLHAVTREPAQVKLKYKNGNLGGTSVMEVTPQEAESIRTSRPHDLVTSVMLDSLAPFINTSVVILKVDSEGRDCQTISSGRALLTDRFTPYIFMEWAVMTNNRHKYHAPCRPHHLREMVQWLASRGYHAHISKSGALLIPSKMESWRAGDIYWRHSTAPPLHPLAQ